MKLYVIRIFVDDWDKACDFYQNILNLPLKFSDAKMGWAEFDVGGVSLGIERTEESDDAEEKFVGRFLGVSLQVENIQSKYEELKAQGVEFTSPPEKQPWGGTLAHFKDTSGNTLTLLG